MGWMIDDDSQNSNPRSTGSNVRVIVRVRPMLARELERNPKCLFQMGPDRVECNLLKPDSADSGNQRAASRRVEDRSFAFDASLWSVDKKDEHYADQQTLYKYIGKEFLDHNFEGYNTCIFAYGQTGSGKTYKEEPGLIPTTCKELFASLEATQSPSISHSAKVSFFEVYNETIRDLLAERPASSSRLRVRESPIEGPYVKDLSEFAVRNHADVMRYLALGQAGRTTAATNMNESSSRSHAVFTLELKQMYHNISTGQTSEKTARIRLVDLAGSERANTSGVTGMRLREGANINKSLTTLGRVIAALAEVTNQPASKRTKEVIPFRDSVLTWLLKDSLGGNSKTAMVACLSPCDYDEGLSTLRYADQAKQIKTNAVVNQDFVSEASRDAEIVKLQETIRSLEIELEEADATKQLNDAQQAKIEQYQEQVQRMQKLMEQNRKIAECKIKVLQTENEALRLHLRLAVDSIKNPLPSFDEPSPSMMARQHNGDELNNDWSRLLRDVRDYKKKLAGDKERFLSPTPLRQRENV